jgi:hypothetical protein
MKRFARVVMALTALTLPVVSIAVVEAGTSSGVSVADRWCC